MFTGFSFGGVLAQLLTAKLWQLPQTKTEKLLSNVICITFGQPLILTDLLTQVVEIDPDFRNSIHAVCSESDSFPFNMEKLEFLASTKKVILMVTISVTMAIVATCIHNTIDNIVDMHMCLLITIVSLSCSVQASLSVVLESLSLLKEFYLTQTPSAMQANTELVQNEVSVAERSKVPPDSTLVVSEGKATASDQKILAVQSELQEILQSKETEPYESTNSSAERHLIVRNKSDLKLVHMNESLQTLKFSKKANLICQETFVQVSYNNLIND